MYFKVCYFKYAPVQIQKLFFLLDREAANFVGGPHFNFQPYDYGPFDSQVYTALNRLRTQNLVQVHSAGAYRLYSLSPEGYRQGVENLREFPKQAVTYMQQAADWGRQLNFQQLVAAIYRYNPDMQVNSIFDQ